MGGTITSGMDDTNFAQSTYSIQPSDIEPTPIATKCRILLLGTGFCGKTTLFFQLQNNHHLLNEKSLEIYKNRIRYYFITMTDDILELYKEKYFDYPKDSEKIKKFLKENNSYVAMMNKKEDTLNILNYISSLWKDQNMLDAFKLYKNDGEAEHFIHKNTIERLIDKDYQPSNDDIIYCRTKTVGTNSITIARKFVYEVVDTGGQKSERKKWKSAMEGTNLVIYVISLSDYDEGIFEDPLKNSMKESIETFNQYINQEKLQNLPVCVLFNKKKLLEKKLKHTNLSTIFPEYKDGDDVEKAVKFIMDKFMSTVKGSNIFFAKVYDVINHIEAETFFSDVEEIAVELQKEGKLKELLI